MNRSKQKGTAFETAIVRWLNQNGYPNAERSPLRGNKDRGDVTGMPGVCIEAKNCKTLTPSLWLDQLKVEMANGTAETGVVIAKRRGTTEADLTGADLTGATLTGATLSGATLSGADLTGANLTGADLTRANLTRANLTRANLTEANLTEANLTRANLRWANLTRANLRWANLTEANLRWANLTEANLTRANLTKADLHRDQVDALLVALGIIVEKTIDEAVAQ